MSSEEQARRAYLGLDHAVGRALTLGLQGFSAATSANIAAQTADGGRSGTISVSGQVDQGASDNKGLRLSVAMQDYSDGLLRLDGGATVDVTYTTGSSGEALLKLPELSLSLRNIPNGSFTGTLAGDFAMKGDLTGTVRLDLSMSGQLEDGGSGAVRRKAGTTTVTGSATAGAGVYAVDVSL